MPLCHLFWDGLRASAITDRKPAVPGLWASASRSAGGLGASPQRALGKQRGPQQACFWQKRTLLRTSKTYEHVEQPPYCTVSSQVSDAEEAQPHTGSPSPSADKCSLTSGGGTLTWTRHRASCRCSTAWCPSWPPSRWWRSSSFSWTWSPSPPPASSSGKWQAVRLLGGLQVADCVPREAKEEEELVGLPVAVLVLQV